MGGSRIQGACPCSKGLQFVLSYKRLDRGTFRLPEPREVGATTVEIEEGALDDLLDGIDLDAPAGRLPGRRRPSLQ